MCLKAAGRSKEEEIASLKLALRASKDREERLSARLKDTGAKLVAADSLKLKWVKWWHEEKDRAGLLELELYTLKRNEPRAQAVEEAKCKKLETEVVNLKDTNQRKESEMAALQEQLSDMEAKHKQLLDKYNDYKKRMRKMGNEH
jgi:septal ring factor EnvC (AmiA/AmiB activator)